MSRSWRVLTTEQQREIGAAVLVARAAQPPAAWKDLEHTYQRCRQQLSRYMQRVSRETIQQLQPLQQK